MKQKTLYSGPLILTPRLSYHLKRLLVCCIGCTLSEIISSQQTRTKSLQESSTLKTSGEVLSRKNPHYSNQSRGLSHRLFHISSDRADGHERYYSNPTQPLQTSCELCALHLHHHRL